MIGWRWIQRSLGLVSVIILARLLEPEDFGLVAMAWIVVGLLEVFADAGVKAALIRHENPTPDHLNTGWTIRIIQRTVIAGALLPAAYLGSAYFDEPRIVPVIHLLAAMVFVNGFENIGTIYFQRELNFRRSVAYSFSQKLVSFCTTIVLAFLLKSYWALVIGSVAGGVYGVLASYVMHGYRPWFALNKFSELWGFSQWMLFVNVVKYGRLKADEIAIGGQLNGVAMGQYTVAFNVATLPTSEVVIPLGRALFPNYSRIAHDAALLKEAFLKALGSTLLFVSPIAVGLAVVSESFVAVVLGDKWLGVAPIVFWLALLGLFSSPNHLVSPLFLALGKTRLLAMLEVVQLCIMAPVAFVAASFGSVVLVAQSRVATMIVILAITYGILVNYLPVRFTELLAMVWRPAFSATVMAGALISADGLLHGGPFMELAGKVGLGILVYVVSQTLLCAMTGFRTSLEYELLVKLTRRFRS